MTSNDDKVGQEATKPKGVTIPSLEALGSISLLNFMKNNPEPWAVRSTKSENIFLNPVQFKILGLPPGFNIEGKRDHECPAPWAEFASQFEQADRCVEQSGQGCSIISIQKYTRQQILQPYVYHKVPLYNDAQQCLGNIAFGKKFSFLTLSQYFKKITPTVLTTAEPTNKFTPRECDIIFYALQGFTSKEIASKLLGKENTPLSFRTIETNMARMYLKAGVNTLSAFKE